MMTDNDDTDIKFVRPARLHIPRLTREDEQRLDAGDDFGVKTGGSRGDDSGDIVGNSGGG